MPTSAIELNKVALVLDPKKIGVYSIDKVIEMLRPEKAKPKPEPATDAEKIAVEVSASRGGWGKGEWVRKGGKREGREEWEGEGKEKVRGRGEGEKGE